MASQCGPLDEVSITKATLNIIACPESICACTNEWVIRDDQTSLIFFGAKHPV